MMDIQEKIAKIKSQQSLISKIETENKRVQNLKSRLEKAEKKLQSLYDQFEKIETGKE